LIIVQTHFVRIMCLAKWLLWWIVWSNRRRLRNGGKANEGTNERENDQQWHSSN
jgi:hypothetical protein